MKTIILTDKEYDEICRNHKFSSDESYNIHTANTIYEAIKKVSPNDLEERL